MKISKRFVWHVRCARKSFVRQVREKYFREPVYLTVCRTISLILQRKYCGIVLRQWKRLGTDDSRDFSRSLLCTVPYGSHVQWRIVNAVKVTRKEEGRWCRASFPLWASTRGSRATIFTPVRPIASPSGSGSLVRDDFARQGTNFLR